VSQLTFKTPLSEGQNKKLREDFTKVLSQQELAEKAGLHLTYVGHLELGKYHPTVFVM